MGGIPFGYGQRFLLDSQMRYTRAGLKVYLRVKNFTEETPQPDGTSTDYLEVGVPFTPTGAASVETGVIDIEIQPPPFVEDANMHNVGLQAGRLNFGSRVFTVSHTFVLNQVRALNLTDPYAVWRDRDGYKVVGLYYNNRLFSIDSLIHREVAGETVSWRIVGNALETEVVEAT